MAQGWGAWLAGRREGCGGMWLSGAVVVVLGSLVEGSKGAALRRSTHRQRGRKAATPVSRARRRKTNAAEYRADGVGIVGDPV